MNIDQSVSKKYAIAFMNVFKQSVKLEQLEYLENFIKFISKHKKALFYVQLLYIRSSIKLDAILSLLHQFKLDNIYENLINTLIAHKRLFLLPEVLKYLVELFKKRNNIIEFTIVTSHRVSDQELDTIHDFLVAQTNKHIIYKHIIDKRLIAGIKLYSDTLGWEHSVRKQLMELGRVQ